MSRKTNNYNAYESSLVGPLAIGATSVAVESAVGLVAPLYLVLDPDDPSKREWIRVNTINSNTLDNLVRDLEGSVGDVLHDAGAKIRSIPTKQIFDDLFQDIEDDELDLTQHETDGGDPHSQAGYLKQAEGDVRYVEVTGDTMSGSLSITPTPTLVAHATRKDYVDTGDSDTEAAAQAYSDSLDHDHDTPIGVHKDDGDAHHAKIHAADGVDHTSGAEVDGRALVADGAGGLKFITPTAGVTDHGVLDGLNDDDHSQYLTNSRGDARYIRNNAGEAIDAATLQLSGNATINRAVAAAGGTSLPAFGFQTASGLGMYQANSSTLGFATNSSNAMLVSAVVFLAPAIFSQTSGGVVNTTVDASGQLFRSTSARKYKSNIVEAPELADLNLVPVTFHHDGDGEDYIGFIADDLAAEDVRLGEFHENEIESFDTRAVLAVLAAKVNRLENA